MESECQRLYLMFTEGYSAHRGEQLTRAELCGEAVGLTRMLVRAELTDLPAVHALLVLMLLQSGRLPARADLDGDPPHLAERDRSRWDRPTTTCWR